MKDYTHTINETVANSWVGRRFRLEGSGHAKSRPNARFLTEIRAGLATFFAMAYIISVNATILTDSGGTCVCTDSVDPTCFADPAYNSCLLVTRRDFITGTAAISALGSFLMGILSNMPIALAPGMGINAYFTYTVVGFHGLGLIPYRIALTAVFAEGFIFIGLSLLGLRQWLARAIPNSIKLASGVGIGLFLTIVGLYYSAGIGAISGATSTPLELAGCLASEMVDGVCPGNTKMRSPTMWIGIFCGGFVTAVLLTYKVKGAIIIGILLVSIISWPRPTSVTYFPYTEAGDEAFSFFKQVVAFHPITNTLNALEWQIGEHGWQFFLALITFLYVDILDCTGTMYAMAKFSGAIDPETQDFEGSAVAYLVDAFSISIGSLFGLAPVTAFIESGAGISEGGKTGITSIVTGLCFFISIFFAPIFASIPPWATGCTLIIVGSMMASAAADINWRYPGDGIPAFITIAVMPFTYSIAYGLIAGILSYIIINSIVWLVELVSGGRIVPEDKHLKEAWTWRIKGGLVPQWVQRAAKGKKDFWHEDPTVTHDRTHSNTEVIEKTASSSDAGIAPEIANDHLIKSPTTTEHAKPESSVLPDGKGDVKLS